MSCIKSKNKLKTFFTFKYLELKPEILIKRKDFDEEYYEKLDQLENDVLDGKTFQTIISGNEKNIKKFKLVNSRKTKEDGMVIEDINKTLFEKVFLIKEINSPQFINFNNKYYVVEVTEEKNITLTLKDKDLRKTIEAQLK